MPCGNKSLVVVSSCTRKIWFETRKRTERQLNDKPERIRDMHSERTSETHTRAQLINIVNSVRQTEKERESYVQRQEYDFHLAVRRQQSSNVTNVYARTLDGPS